MVETRRSSKRMSTPPRLMSLPKRGKGSKKSTTLDAPDSDATKSLTASVELYSDEQKKNANEVKKSTHEQLEQIKRKIAQIKRNNAYVQAKVEELKRLLEDMDTTRHEQLEDWYHLESLLNTTNPNPNPNNLQRIVWFENIVGKCSASSNQT